MPVSHSTLIRDIHSQELQKPQNLQIIGLGDLDFRKGLTYGTVLVDMQKERSLIYYQTEKRKLWKNG
jgi:hypothetical protein